MFNFRLRSSPDRGLAVIILPRESGHRLSLTGLVRAEGQERVRLFSFANLTGSTHPFPIRYFMYVRRQSGFKEKEGGKEVGGGWWEVWRVSGNI